MKKFLFACAILALTSAAALAQTAEPNHTIAVQGEADLSVAPDQASIEIGVVTQDVAVAKALADNSTKMAKVIATIRTLGIKDKDIETSTFQIQPRYAKRTQGDFEYDEMRPITGYAVTNNVTITVSDLPKISKVIDTAVTAGANTSGTVSFHLKDGAKYMDQARTEAIKSARHKAEILTTAAGVELGKAILITDNQASTQYGNRGNARNYETVTVSAKRAETPIQSGQITLTATVSMVFEIK